MLLLVSVGSADLNVWSAITCGISVAFLFCVPYLVVSMPGSISFVTYMALCAATPAALLAGIAPALDTINTPLPALTSIVVATILAQNSIWLELAARLRAKKHIS